MGVAEPGGPLPVPVVTVNRADSAEQRRVRPAPGPSTWVERIAGSPWGYLAALSAGALLPLALAPLKWVPVSFLAPAVLFLLWLHVTPRRALQLGFLFGIGCFLVGASWINVSIAQFGGVTPAFAAVVTALFVLIMAAYPALAGWCANALFRSSPAVRLLWVYPLLWTGFEWLRGWLFSGFNWLNLGSAQLEWPLGGLAPVLGVYGVGASVAFSAGVLVLLVVTDPPGRLWAVTGAVILWVGSGLARGVEWTEPAGPRLKVSLIQGNIAQGVKWKPAYREFQLELYRDLTRKHWDSDLIIWPETAVPAFYHRVARRYLAPLGAEAAARGSDVLLGIPYGEPGTGALYNSMLKLGGEQELYHKRHLVPYGEYMPMKPLLSAVLRFLEVPMSDFAAGGADQRLITLAGYPVGVSVCYEDAYGREVIDALPQAAFLVNASNDAWFGDSLAPHQHLEIARMRALETGRYLLRATNTGISALIGPHGELLSRSPQFETDVLSGEILPMQGLTPYARFGDYALLPLLVPLLFLLRKPRKA